MFDRSAGDAELSRAELLRLFDLLEEELRGANVIGELYLVGGAVMCLAHAARPSTRDVDAVFRPTATVRQAAKRVAARAGVSESWLNDAVKGFLSPHGEFAPFHDGAHLKIFVAPPAYLLALKCMAMRLGPGFRDEDDVRFLLRALNITSREEAIATIGRYFDVDTLPQKTWYALDDLLPRS